MTFYDETGQQYLLCHGVVRSRLSRTTKLYIVPQNKAQWDEHVRNIIVIPVVKKVEDGKWHYVIYDNTGFLSRLEALKLFDRRFR